MVNKKILLSVTVIAMLTLSALVVWAGEGAEEEQEMLLAASTVTPMMNYQGQLTDSAGDPLTGTYTMTFRLYEVASGGTARDTDTHTVVVTDG